MEGNTQLMKVIQEMRSEINKLEKENKALRVELDFTSQKASAWEGNREKGEARRTSTLGEELVTAPIAIHRTVSADSALALKEPKGNIMTVRRYTISSSVHSFAAHEHCKSGKGHMSSGILEAQGMMKSPACSPVTKLANEDGKGFAAGCFTSNTSNKRTFQDHVFKCRGKIKAVSFLLPMEMSSYSKDPDSLECIQNQNPKQLSTIMEKDM
ncbi:putative coiled-coil domain-containing protein 195 [Antechinus flavipes]|uniref:putative coiled-coil domain-containing protein 195 n=1 Tax=Antechinus flavipes TaxID=38775 RepID=UPI002236A69F|nr:putative coiled-coil domain-containing protein 195 [Antechinus flavipes]